MFRDTRYRIEGITPLRGEVTLSGAKNAALPCMCAALLTKEEVVLHNVPEIADVFTLLEIFSFLGVKYRFENHSSASSGHGNTLHITAENLDCKKVPHELVKKFRASILLLGPILSRCNEVMLSYPGGCVLGKRPVDAHINALVQLGAEDYSNDEMIHLRGTIKGGEVILPEFSVTATENVLLAAAASQGRTSVHIAATEPHVQDLCRLLQAMGVQITGTGTHDLIIQGSPLHGAEHIVTTDYLEAGFFALAGVLTGGDLRVRGVQREHLMSFFKAMDSINAAWKFEEDDLLHVHGGNTLKWCRVQTNIFPGFPTDLQAAFGVAMTQANGVSRIHEVMYEGRFGYLFELEKMGAHVELLNAHEALIIGPTPLHGRMVTSNDIRAGAAMVLAALCARGETIIADVQYIERGYENLEEKLRSVGASIERLDGNKVDSVHTSDFLSINGKDSEQRRKNSNLRERDRVAPYFS